MAFTKIAAAGIGSTGTVTLENIVVTGDLNASIITGSNNLNISGVSTLGNTVVGGATTQLIVTGNARVTGILTIGTSSITLDGSENQVNVGTGVTIHHTNGVQVGGNTVHSAGLTINQLNASGIVTANSFRGDGSQLTGIAVTTNVRTNSLIVSGMTTATGGIQVGATTSIVVGDTFIKRGAVGLGTTSTTGRNAGVGTAAGTIIFNSTANTVEVYDGSTWKQLYSGFLATGGTITSAGGKTIHTFAGTGTFSLNSAPPTFAIDYLIVAGGGGAGGGYNSGGGFGGGAAGGMRTGSGTPLPPGPYVITVGSGGPQNSNGNPSSISGPSIFSTITSDGGGRGGGGGPGPAPAFSEIAGGSGGSGGGGGKGPVSTGGSGNTPPTSPSQGNPGGNSVTVVSAGGAWGPGAGGGGGGAGGPGGNGAISPPSPGPSLAGPMVAGNGGNGATSTISGSPVTYAGGGGGGLSEVGGASGPFVAGSGGPGGGGAGAPTPAPRDGSNGTINLGGGGGACTTTRGVSGNGGSGGSGIVIIAYPS